jgi:hypothetical protein
MSSSRPISSPQSQQQLLTIAGVAEALTASRDLVESLIRAGDLTAVDISPRRDDPRHRPAWRVRPEDLENFIAGRLSAPTPNPPAPQKSRVRPSPGVREFI